jgi:hypothetical protein
MHSTIAAFRTSASSILHLPPRRRGEQPEYVLTKEDDAPFLSFDAETPGTPVSGEGLRLQV